MLDKVNLIHLDKVAQSSLDAIDWLAAVAPHNHLVDEQKNALEIKLADLRNLAQAADTVVDTPTTVGVFGGSQVGKSYLVSTLASGGKGKEIKTNWDNVSIDFMSHLNPRGEEESTGIVTRFTKADIKTPTGFPAKARIFNEVEVVKCLSSSFFLDILYDKDYMDEHDKFFKDENAQKEFFKELSQDKYLLKEDSTEKNYVTSADIVDLAIFVQENSNKSVLNSMDNTSYFWTETRHIIEKINLEGRAKLYGKLWSYLPVFENLFSIISKDLLNLKGKSVLYLPLDAFVNKVNDEYLQLDGGTIVDIRAVKKIFEVGENQIEVALDDEKNEIAKISFATLTFLTCELVFKIDNAESTNNFDVLDFPGARERLDNNISDWLGENKIGKEDIEGKSAFEFLKRGKVAYLIKKYIKQRAIDVLLICYDYSAPNQEVKEPSIIVDQWLTTNVDLNTLKSGKRKAPTAVVFTKTDAAIEKSLSSDVKTSNPFASRLTNACKRFTPAHKDEYLGGDNFNQMFLVRKPNFKNPKIKLFTTDENWVETGINQETGLSNYYSTAKEIIDNFKAAIVADKEHAKCLFGYNENDGVNSDVLDYVFTPNDGGIGYLVEFITNNFNDFKDNKEKLLKDLVKDCNDLRNGIFAQMAKEDVDKIKNERINKAIENINNLKQCENLASTFTTIREFIDLDLDKAIDIYTTKGVDGAEDNAARYASDIKEMWQQNLDNIFKEQGSGFNELLANIMSALTPNKIENINKLSPIEKRRAQYSFFLNSSDEVITKEAEIKTKLSDLLDYFRKQLIQNFNLLDVEVKIRDGLFETERDTSHTREQIAPRQANFALKTIADFNSYLRVGGYDHKIEEYYSKGSGRALFGLTGLFAYPTFIPSITQDMKDKCAEYFFSDYFDVFIDLMVIGLSTADSIYKLNEKQNSSLCAILNSYDENLLHYKDTKESA